MTTSVSEAGDLLGELCRQAARLLDGSNGPVHTVRLRAGDLAVEVERPGIPDGVRPVVVNDVPVEPDDADPDGAESICAPTVGTFYRAPEPGAEPFVREGDRVEAGQQVAILEAMKLMNPIEAEATGRVVRVLVPDGESVEYGQPLFVIAPAA
ncbi:acetyl-CoA carboxylase biotin carboxyl carrier protein [Fodinicola acaciae]|uniref:acetyl-CoA carboxylase biotin carboxyl carrier protein n=1 Tax=Fodinicola acaciae TaxID=2681555 RepID=UPI0013D2A64C|nr:acetyl-CoA carboxylase biotin carboxyl carrier protein subunit [Fodinicola acaciae]